MERIQSGEPKGKKLDQRRFARADLLGIEPKEDETREAKNKSTARQPSV